MKRRITLWLVLAVQVICTAIFLWELFGSRVGLRTEPISWRLHEVIQILAALGLVVGIGLGAVLATRIQQRNRVVEAQLDAASSAFAEVVERRFEDWGLTPAERDVAWFAVKGFATAEIAGLRNTSESTVKAQTNAIYRKAGVNGRAQLLSLFVDELLNRTHPAPLNAETRAVS